MKRLIKKIASASVAVILALLLALQAVPAIALTTAGENGELSPYGSFTILGDSLCLGFSTAAASMADTSTYDIEKNALYNIYPHCYPSQFAQMLGLDVDYSDGTTDLYNFGICAAWSGDIYDILTDPFYEYEYFMTTYDENTTFVLPEDYTNNRYIVANVDEEGYDVGNPATWIYAEDEEGDYLGVESYTIPAGTEIHVAYAQEYWGMRYMVLNTAIAEKYYYVSEYSFDEDGHLIDTNGDGKIDDADYIPYPTEIDGSDFSYYPVDNEENRELYGRAIANPKFAKYYYDLITGAVSGTDLIALAAGGNDIYHSFMPYQQESGTMLGMIVYLLSYAFQMNMSVGDIANMIEGIVDMADAFDISVDEAMSWMFGFDFGIDDEGGDDLMMTAEDHNVMSAEAPAAEAPLMEGLEDIELLAFALDEILGFLDWYSAENVTAYLDEVVENYKINTEKTIQRVLELKGKDATFALIKHFNPFAFENYITMLALQYENGELGENVSKDVQSLFTLITTLAKFIDTDGEIEFADDKSFEDILADVTGLQDEELTQLVTDLSYPLAALLMGSALSDTYAEMNAFVDEMAAKYDLPCVDISGCPTNGRYDPHPGNLGHTWIAQKLYETLVPTITANISEAGTGFGTVSSLGVNSVALHDNVEYRFLPAYASKVSAVYIDGELLDMNEYPEVYTEGRYVFENILESHTITVQFDTDWNNICSKYSVNVRGSYSTVGTGEGLYPAGTLVSIKAGENEGFEFAGWVSSGVALSDPTSPIASFEMPYSDVTVVATWRDVNDEQVEPVDYVVTLETNGGTPIDPITFEEGSMLTLAGFVTEKPGYIFDGWYFDKELGIPMSNLVVFGDTTIYAKWIEEDLDLENPPVISVAGSHGGFGHGEISSLGANVVDYHSDKEIIMVPAEGSFISAIFVDGIWLNPLVPAYAQIYSSGVYTFKDITRNHSIIVQFDRIADGGTNYTVNVLGSYASEKSGAGFYRPGATVYIDAGEMEGYQFMGWEFSNGLRIADPTAAKTTFVMPNDNVTVAAVWLPLYTIEFDTKGGTPIETVVFTRGTELNLLEDFETTKEGLHLEGWYYDEEFTKPADPFVLKADTKLYARWQAKIHIDTKGGTPIKDFYLDEGETFDLSALETTKAGLHFGGFYSDEDFTDRVTEIVASGDLDLYAKFFGYITFETNGGTEIADAEIIDGTEVDLKDYTTTKGDTEFLGWYKEPDIRNPIDNFKFSKDITVYANWADHSVAFMTNGGTKVSPVRGIKGMYVNFANYMSIKPGMTLEGWYKDQNLTMRVDEMYMDGSIVVYAKWTGKIVIDLDGGTGVDPEIEISTYDYINTLKLQPTKEGYKFEGFYFDPEFTQKVPDIYQFEENVNFYAKWTAVGSDEDPTDDPGKDAPPTGAIVTSNNFGHMSTLLCGLAVSEKKEEEEAE